MKMKMKTDYLTSHQFDNDEERAREERDGLHEPASNKCNTCGGTFGDWGCVTVGCPGPHDEPVTRRRFIPQDVRDHYTSLVADWQFEGSRIPRVRAAIELWCRIVWWPAVCWALGHQYESCADVENGTEDVWCVRCGECHHAQF